MRLIFFLLFITPACFAQTNPKQKDTFAINILSTVDKVLRVAEDPRRSALELAGEPVKVGFNGSTVYKAAIQLPGAVSAQYEQLYTWRSSGSTQWQWEARLIELPKGQGAALIPATQKKVDSLLNFFKSRKRPANPDGDWEVRTSAWSNSTLYPGEGLLLIIRLRKKLHNTEQQAIDSLVKLYQPLMTDPKIAYQRATTFGNAFRLEGISEEKTAEVYLKVIKDIAAINIESAYNMMMSAPYFIKTEDIMAQFTPAQKERVHGLAKKTLADFYGTTPTAADPIIEKKKEIMETQPPSDPCERETWELSIKPGQYIAGNGRTAYVRDYNCASDHYTIFYMNPAGQRLLSESVSKVAIQSYRQTSAAPFIICSNCRGAGYSMEYDWYQVNVASNYYARSNDQRKYTCGVCSGSGFIKVR